MEFLNSASANAIDLAGYDDEDDALEEETLLETPLDLIEPYQLFRGALLGMFLFRGALVASLV
jgi:hypothetical protein